MGPLSRGCLSADIAAAARPKQRHTTGSRKKNKKRENTYLSPRFHTSFLKTERLFDSFTIQTLLLARNNLLYGHIQFFFLHPSPRAATSPRKLGLRQQRVHEQKERKPHTKPHTHTHTRGSTHTHTNFPTLDFAGQGAALTQNSEKTCILYFCFWCLRTTTIFPIFSFSWCCCCLSFNSILLGSDTFCRPKELRLQRNMLFSHH